MIPSQLVPSPLAKRITVADWRQTTPAWMVLLFLGGLAMGSLTGSHAASAHGVVIQQNNAVEVEARFDTGTPLAEAQVAVFAPDEPEVPVLTGTTDANGKFQFVPDPTREGDWSVQVRSAGHGAIATVPVGPHARIGQFTSDVDTAHGTVKPMTAMQRLVMGSCVLWGLLGTALFFLRRSQSRSSPIHSSHRAKVTNSV